MSTNSKKSFSNTIGQTLAAKINEKTSKELKFMARKYESNEQLNHFQPSIFDLNGRKCYSDGYDHINICQNGATELGRELALEAPYTFTIPKYGRFSSIFAMWTWLNAKGHPAFLRDMPSHLLRAFHKSSTENGTIEKHPYAIYICVYVMMDRIMNDKRLQQALINSDGHTLTGYYVSNNRSIQQAHAYWWVTAINMIRSQLVADVELDVSSFAPDINKFSQALIKLDSPVRLGELPVLEQDPLVESESTTEKEPPERNRRQLTEQECKAPDPQYCRKFVFEDQRKRFDFMRDLILTTPDQIVALFHGTSPVVPTRGNETPGSTAELADLKHSLIVVFDPETKGLVSMSTDVFPDPYLEPMQEEPQTVVGDTSNDIEANARLIMGVDPDTYIKFRYINGPKLRESVPETVQMQETTD